MWNSPPKSSLARPNSPVTAFSGHQGSQRLPKGPRIAQRLPIIAEATERSVASAIIGSRCAMRGPFGSRCDPWWPLKAVTGLLGRARELFGGEFHI